MTARTIKLIFIGVLSIFATIYTFRDAADAKIYLTASQQVLKGKSPYEQLYEIKNGGEIHVLDRYFYSPFFAWLLMPFAFLPLKIAVVLWQLLGIFFFILLWQTVKKFLGIEASTSKKELILLLTSSLLVIRFLGQNLERGQITFFILFASLYSILLIINGNRISGAALLALVINIKILPVTLVPYLVYRRQFQAAGYVALFVFLFLFLPAAWTGWNDNMDLHAQWWDRINPFQEKYLTETEPRHYDIAAWLPTLLMNTSPAGKLSINRNLFDFNAGTVSLVIQLARLFLIVFTLYFLRSLPFRNEENREKIFWELSYIFLITPLIFPFQSKYAFFYAFPAIAYSLHFIFRIYTTGFSSYSRTKTYGAILCIAVYFMLANVTSINISGRQIYDLSQHFKSISYGILCLIVALGILTPQVFPRRKQVV